MAMGNTAGTALAPQMLDTAVLVQLKRHPSHGYALLGPLQELGVETGDLTRVYRLLRKLESEGMVTSTWGVSGRGRGPARKIYSITRSGHRHLRQRMQDLRANSDLLQRIERQYLEFAAEDR